MNGMVSTKISYCNSKKDKYVSGFYYEAEFDCVVVKPSLLNAFSQRELNAFPSICMKFNLFLGCLKAKLDFFLLAKNKYLPLI